MRQAIHDAPFNTHVPIAFRQGDDQIRVQINPGGELHPPFPQREIGFAKLLRPIAKAKEPFKGIFKPGRLKAEDIAASASYDILVPEIDIPGDPFG